MTDDAFDQIDKLAMTSIAVRHGDAATIGLQDAPQLTDSGCAIVNVVKHVRRTHNVKRGIAKRQLLHVTTYDGTPCAFVRGADHPDRCIESHGFKKREVAAVPAADFEDTVAVVNIGKMKAGGCSSWRTRLGIASLTRMVSSLVASSGSDT